MPIRQMAGEVRVSIIGGSGYVGGELLRLLLFHGGTSIKFVTSKQHDGDFVYRVHPNLRSTTDLQFSNPPFDQLARSSDLVFVALPHTKSTEIVTSLLDKGVKVIDMSADFRLKDAEDYKIWYDYNHPKPELLKASVYGVPELYADEIRGANFVSCPGCMAITSILPLAPFCKGGLIDTQRIVIDAKIGSSGAGSKVTPGTSHSERYGVVRPYKPVHHRHTVEIEQELSRLAGKRVLVSMTPHGVNMVRGILCSIHTFLPGQLSQAEVWRTLRSFYQGKPFVRFVKDKQGLYHYPDPKILSGSNFCDIGFELDDRSNRLLLLSATDNLMKGAAGCGIQCMNLMFGFKETDGLEFPGLHPI
jgi:N-acetyl-gamma-glutamyl-phosphate/LysW-gamma-L-alpha-aminoadipyl-6-phosphate reductase